MVMEFCRRAAQTATAAAPAEHRPSTVTRTVTRASPTSMMCVPYVDHEWKGGAGRSGALHALGAWPGHSPPSPPFLFLPRRPRHLMRGSGGGGGAESVLPGELLASTSPNPSPSLNLTDRALARAMLQQRRAPHQPAPPAAVHACLLQTLRTAKGACCCPGVAGSSVLPVKLHVSVCRAKHLRHLYVGAVGRHGPFISAPSYRPLDGAGGVDALRLPWGRGVMGTMLLQGRAIAVPCVAR